AVLGLIGTGAFVTNSLAAFGKSNIKNDSDILGLIKTINENEINAAKQAMNKTTNQEVLNFAKKLEQDHSDSLDKVNQLGEKMNISTENNEDIREQKEKGADELAKLEGINDDQKYAKTYMKSMID